MTGIDGPTVTDNGTDRPHRVGGGMAEAGAQSRLAVETGARIGDIPPHGPRSSSPPVGIVNVKYALVLLSLLLAGCGTVPEPDPADTPAVPLTTGTDVLNAMHARYADSWYERLCVRQKVVIHDQNGEPQSEEVWTELIELPGKVRSIVGEESAGRGELYVDGAFHIIRDGRVAHFVRQVHPVLLIGYDVYRQDPAETIRKLEEAGFDLAQLHETEWDGRPTYVIGAAEGDETSNQFWIDADRLLCARIITTSPGGMVYDIRFTKYEPFAGVWLCTELIFRRNGGLMLSEYDLEHSIPESIDPETFTPPPPKMGSGGAPSESS